MSDSLSPPAAPPPTMDQHAVYMRLALLEACKSPPKPTNFRVGALLVAPSASASSVGAVLATGYTLELEGNTHAEQVCLRKVAAAAGVREEHVGAVLPEGTVLYTTVEPCAKRLSGNEPCVERILRTRKEEKDSKGEGLGRGGIAKVYVGVKEPETFVGENQGRKKLEEDGVEVILIEGMEEEILLVATAGHEKK